jgi:mono/diheme cytochrome c family protein
LLLEIVTQGSDFPQSQMPTFGDQLTDDEVRAILEYIKSWWGPEERAFQWQVTWQAQQQE